MSKDMDMIRMLWFMIHSFKVILLPNPNKKQRKCIPDLGCCVDKREKNLKR